MSECISSGYEPVERVIGNMEVQILSLRPKLKRNNNFILDFFFVFVYNVSNLNKGD